jgi:hypothetical protein
MRTPFAGILSRQSRDKFERQAQNASIGLGGFIMRPHWAQVCSGNLFIQESPAFHEEHGLTVLKMAASMRPGTELSLVETQPYPFV